MDPWESEQSGWTETVKVLTHLQQKVVDETSGQAQLKFLCGADLLESFATPGLWKAKDVSYPHCQALETTQLSQSFCKRYCAV